MNTRKIPNSRLAKLRVLGFNHTSKRPVNWILSPSRLFGPALDYLRFPKDENQVKPSNVS